MYWHGKNNELAHYSYVIFVRLQDLICLKFVGMVTIKTWVIIVMQYSHTDPGINFPQRCWHGKNNNLGH